MILEKLQEQDLIPVKSSPKTQTFDSTGNECSISKKNRTNGEQSVSKFVRVELFNCGIEMEVRGSEGWQEHEGGSSPSLQQLKREPIWRQNFLRQTCSSYSLSIRRYRSRRQAHSTASTSTSPNTGWRAQWRHKTDKRRTGGEGDLCALCVGRGIPRGRRREITTITGNHRDHITASQHIITDC